MSGKIDIRSVGMVRHIRNELVDKQKGRSHAEILKFFNKAGDAAREEARRRRKIQPQNKSYANQ